MADLGASIGRVLLTPQRKVNVLFQEQIEESC